MNSVLHAVQTNNTRALNELLNLPTSSRDVENALFYACQSGLVDCVRCLLQKGSGDPNARNVSGYTPMFLAVKEGHHEVLAVLCDAGAKVDSRVGNSTALHVAAKMGKDECLEILLERGCSINVVDSTSSTALILAVKGKHYVAIANLIRSGCNLDSRDDQGRTALHYACHTAVAVDQLLKAGARVNICDNQGCTPLLMAATEGLERVVHSLCQSPGIDVNISNDCVKKTPLHILAYKGHIRCVRDLIAAGADINLLDSESKNPLWYAVANAKRDVTALLLKSNGLVDTYQCPVEHPEHACPVRIAVDKSHIDILKLLILSGYDNKHVRECLILPKAHALFSDYQVNYWLQHAQEVTSLRQICRKLIRHHLGIHLFMDLSKLPLPEKLKSYLLLEELDALVKVSH
uniref:SOCS box domain-containing protein n=2 Tax=Arion vulgaris TaxID=1028688 RepID=A0A0B6ZR90_9EUPU